MAVGVPSLNKQDEGLRQMARQQFPLQSKTAQYLAVLKSSCSVL